MDNLYINNALAFVVICTGSIGTAYVGVKAFYILRDVADPSNIVRFEQHLFGQPIMDQNIEEAINSVNNLAKKVVSNFLLGNQFIYT
jgi:hypothetical protein